MIILNSNPVNRIVRVLWVLGFMSSLCTYAQNAPITAAPEILTDSGSMIDVPVFVSGFNNIGAVSLTINYDPAVLIYQSSVFNNLFPELSIDNPTPGTLIIGGYKSSDGTGLTLNDNSVLFTSTFTFLGGSSELTWNDNGTSCEYTGPSPSYTPLTDSPQAIYYLNGSVSQYPIPGTAGPISGPLEGIVCSGQEEVIFSVAAIANATDYIWILPMGASITDGGNTNEIWVTFGSNASDGSISVYGANAYGSGELSPPFQIAVFASPVILTQPVSADPVNAGSGIASVTVIANGEGLTYKWQEFVSDWSDIINDEVYTGSTTDSLIITFPPVSMNGYRYRCILSGNCEPSIITDGNAMLTVNEMVDINIPQPAENDKHIFVAYPNPCKDLTTFRYYLPENCEVKMDIRNLVGKVVNTLTFLSQHDGFYEKSIEIDQLAPGIYYAVLHTKFENNLSERTVKLVIGK